MGCTVAENERNPDQGDDENALHDIQQHKSVCEIPATGIFFVCLFVCPIYQRRLGLYNATVCHVGWKFNIRVNRVNRREASEHESGGYWCGLSGS
jgi:hypothetical protein